jgi:hypothetical protein
MLTALYYPHTRIKNAGLIKNALLLWDRIEYISPNLDWQPAPVANAPHLNRAVDLIVRPYLPSAEEKRLAHEAILELANSNLPEWFFVDQVDESLQYDMYHEKFLTETWDVLQDSKLAKPNTQQFSVWKSFELNVVLISHLTVQCRHRTKAQNFKQTAQAVPDFGLRSQASADLPE